MEFLSGQYDIAVIGAGHAGIEASLAAARLGASVAVFTISLDFIGNMPCNPSIGGTSKGHLVREIDALGGEMGKAADKNTIQSRMLNLGKGPAVHSLRAQIDRRGYAKTMKYVLEKQENLHLRQAEIVRLEKSDGIFRLTTKLDEVYEAKAVILATGTFLDGKIYVGDKCYSGGPDGMFPSVGLADSLKKMNIPLRRFKTGTPSRVNARSLDFSVMEPQSGDEIPTPFSFETNPDDIKNSAVCYISYTNEKTKKVILDNIDRSPLYSGVIKGIGPRYCPSFEDKVMRFPDKKRHQLFIEPCGKGTEEMYLSGMSSSMPVDVQLGFLRTIKGLENVEVMRNAYAIEYWCVDPTAMKRTLEFKDVEYLYGAGQFNGSSGYEEAACQGLVAGINAALKIKGEKPMILDRASSYIGTLIDDLVTKGCNEPYRMMTSRSEYRLYLRQDNADLRLTPIGREIGLISDERYEKFLKKKEMIENETERVRRKTIAPEKGINEYLVQKGTAPLSTGIKEAELIKRPQLKYSDVMKFDNEAPDVPRDVAEQVEITLKYEGYIKMQLAEIKEMRRLENKIIPENTDYSDIGSLRKEAREKLSKIRPETLGQASRISGVSPADISVLAVYLSRKGK